MSQMKFRFIQSIASAITPTFNALLTVGDKLTDVFAKVQGLLAVRNTRTVSVTSFTGGASSTADINIVSLSIPANYLAVGTPIAIVVRGSLNKPLSAGTTINFWVKIAGTKVATLTYNPAAGITSRPFTLRGELTTRAIGASGSIYGVANVFQATSTTAGVNLTSLGLAKTVNTTTAVVVDVGFNFSNSNSSNSVTALIANIQMG